jgi:hypothetical protein
MSSPSRQSSRLSRPPSLEPCPAPRKPSHQVTIKNRPGPNTLDTRTLSGSRRHSAKPINQLDSVARQVDLGLKRNRKRQAKDADLGDGDFSGRLTKVPAMSLSKSPDILGSQSSEAPGRPAPLFGDIPCAKGRGQPTAGIFESINGELRNIHKSFSSSASPSRSLKGEKAINASLQSIKVQLLIIKGRYEDIKNEFYDVERKYNDAKNERRVLEKKNTGLEALVLDLKGALDQRDVPSPYSDVARYWEKLLSGSASFTASPTAVTSGAKSGSRTDSLPTVDRAGCLPSPDDQNRPLSRTKREPSSDGGPSRGPAGLPHCTEADDDHNILIRLLRLERGILSYFSRSLQVPYCPVPEAIDFISSLPRFTDPGRVVHVSHRFWKMESSWLLDRPATLPIASSMSGKLIQLCFMFRYVNLEGNSIAWQTIIDLLIHLMHANYENSPSCAAFLGTLARSTWSLGRLQTPKLLVALMTCEFAQLLESTFPDVPGMGPWTLTAMFGHSVHVAMDAHLIGKFACALHSLDPLNLEAFRDNMKAKGEDVCIISDMDGHGTDIALLPSGEGEHFFIVNFMKKTLRMVDSRLAWMQNDASGQRMALVISQNGRDLFKVHEAPKEVVAWWVTHALP